MGFISDDIERWEALQRMTNSNTDQGYDAENTKPEQATCLCGHHYSRHVESENCRFCSDCPCKDFHTEPQVGVEIPYPQTDQAPLESEYRVSNGFLCNGSVRLMRADFDTNPSDVFKQEFYDYLLRCLHSQPSGDPFWRDRKPDQAHERNDPRITEIDLKLDALYRAAQPLRTTSKRYKTLMGQISDLSREKQKLAAPPDASTPDQAPRERSALRLLAEHFTQLAERYEESGAPVNAGLIDLLEWRGIPVERDAEISALKDRIVVAAKSDQTRTDQMLTIYRNSKTNEEFGAAILTYLGWKNFRF